MNKKVCLRDIYFSIYFELLALKPDQKLTEGKLSLTSVPWISSWKKENNMYPFQYLPSV